MSDTIRPVPAPPKATTPVVPPKWEAPVSARIDNAEQIRHAFGLV